MKTVVAQRGSVRSWITATGTLLPVNEARISSKVAGRIAKMLVDEGDSVKEGEELLILEQKDFVLARAQASHNLIASKANLESVKTGLRNAEREYERIKELHASNTVSQQDFDSAQHAYEAAQAALDVAKASVEVAEDALSMAEDNLLESTLRSPLSGQLAKRYVNVGELVSPASPVPCFHVIDDSVCKVESHLPDKEQSNVRLGQQVRVSVDGIHGSEFAGEITYIGNTIDPASRTLIVRARLPNDEGVLRPGSLARLRILADERSDVVIVPLRCVVKRNGTPMVFLVNSDRASATPVELGLSGMDDVEILKGLGVGDEVVIAGTEGLEDGMLVKVMNPVRAD